jgi:hypothetical protein
VARSVYSTLFLREAGLTGHAVYIVPVGFRAVVRDMDFYGNNTDPESAIYVIDDVTSGTFFQHQISVSELGAPSWFQWQGRQVFNPLDSFHVGVGTSGVGTSAYDIHVSGYLLALP